MLPKHLHSNKTCQPDPCTKLSPAQKQWLHLLTLISRLLIRSQVQHPLELHPKANCTFRPCLGGRANPHKTSEWKQKCMLLKEKKKKRREKPLHPCTQHSPTNQMPFAPAPNLHCNTGGASLCTPRAPHGHSQPQTCSSHSAAQKGLTPSSCSPDAGSGIHICVIINLRVSAGDGGSCGPPLPAFHSSHWARGSC